MATLLSRMTTDFEVLHAGRTRPDGDPAALIREQLQRVLREAERLKLQCFIEPSQKGHAVSVLPGRAAA